MAFSKFWSVIALAVLFTVSSASADAYDPPASYYSSATGTGATLKNQLTTIMSTGHIQRTYGDYRYAAALFEADPNHSGNILLVYNRASVSATWDGGITWNREHVWPQSLQPGSVSNSSKGNLGDHHALRACNPSINSSRGNDPYGNIDSSGSYGAVTGGYYYPGDADAGDIARALFYSDTRWTSLGLSLVNTYPTGYQMGNLASLIEWNYADPPDEFERRRNQTIYSSALNPSYYQNNRNAYIDHPEYVWSIYGGGNNNSQISVGGVANADGSSAVTVDLGRVITGSAVPAAQSVSVIKFNSNPTYYEVTTSGDATSSITGRYNAFVSGVGITSLDAGLNTSTATAGLKSGTITVDNIDITSGGTGMGSADADDIITVNLDVVDHAQASFASGLDQNLLTIDFGSVNLGGTLDTSFDIFNLEQTFGYTADLDLDSILGFGDTSILTTNLSAFSGLTAGYSNDFLASFDTSTMGSFSAMYTLTLSDEDITGATNQVLTLQLLGEVTGLEGDLDGDGFVGLDDLDIVLGNWNQSVPPAASNADPSGDGFVGLDDLDIVLNNWNEGTPPATDVVPEPTMAWLLGLGITGLIARRRAA